MAGAERSHPTETIAKFLLLTPRRVRQLTAEGIFTRARDPETGEFLRGRYSLVETKEAELRLKVIKGKLHRAEDVEFLMTQRDSAIKAQFLAIPSRVARLLVGKTDFQEIFELLTRELHAVLENLSAYDPRAFTEANEAYLAKLFP